MAKVVLDATDLTFAGTDRSANVKNCQVAVDVETHDVTDFESAGWTEMIGGAKSWSLSFDVDHDSDLSGLDSDIWSNLGASVAILVEVDGDSSVDATNPSFSGNVLVTAWNFGGPVNAPNSPSFTFPGTGALTRNTS